MMTKHRIEQAATLILLSGVFAAPAFALEALDPWDADARAGLTTPVKVWLACLHLVNLSALGFVRKHVGARWMFGGYFLSHVVGLILMLMGFEFLVGQVSILHFLFWTPGAIALLIKRDEIRLETAYGIWASLALFIYFGSMFFDIPDGIAFLTYWLGSGGS